MIHIPRSAEVAVYGPEIANVSAKWVDPHEFEDAYKLCVHMLRTMRRHNCIGISAPQVHVFKQALVIECSSGPLAMVNPEITRMYGKELDGFESCMSVPPAGNGCYVPRMETVDIDYFSPRDPHTLKTITLSGPEAIVAQHEIDHLFGTFFFERVAEQEKKRILKQLQQRKEYVHAQDNSRSLSPVGA